MSHAGDLTSDLETARQRGRKRSLGIVLGLAIGLPATLAGLHAWVTFDRGPAPSGQAPLPQVHPVQLAPGLAQVHMSGEGYPLGRAHGEALRAEIRDLVRFLNEELLDAAQRDWVLRKAWKLDAFVPERFRQEMKGVADGAGVRYADILLINTFDDLQHVSGCSSAVAEGDASHPLRHARNLDYPIPYLARHKVVLDLDTRGRRLRLVGFPGFIGALTGMSDRGLALTSHTSASHRNAVGEPSGLLYRRMLEEAASLEDMARILASAHRTLGNNLALSDGPRHRSLALEFDAAGWERRPASQGRLFVTNHFQSLPLQPHQDAGWWSPTSGSSARVACLARSLPPGDLEPAAFLAALSERGPGTAWRTPANAGTVLSVLMEPATGRLWVAKGTRPPVTVRGSWTCRGVGRRHVTHPRPRESHPPSPRRTLAPWSKASVPSRSKARSFPRFRRGRLGPSWAAWNPSSPIA